MDFGQDPPEGSEDRFSIGFSCMGEARPSRELRGIGIHHRLDRNRLVVAIAFAVIVNGLCRISLVSEKSPVDEPGLRRCAVKREAMAHAINRFLRARSNSSRTWLPVTLLIRADELCIGKYVAPHCSLDLRFCRAS
jgi:hypothetical protein